MSQATNKKADDDEFTLSSSVRVARAECDGYTVHHIIVYCTDGSVSSRMLRIRIPSTDQESIDNVRHRLRSGTRVEIGDWSCTAKGEAEIWSYDDIGVNCDFDYTSKNKLPISDTPRSLRIVGDYEQPKRQPMIKTWWGDAQVEIALAKLLYIPTADIIRDDDREGYPHWNVLNVATTRAAYAFELIFKVLLIASGREWKGKHEPSATYRLLSSPAPHVRSHRHKMTTASKNADKDEVDQTITRHGWDAHELLSRLDEMCDADRKYWMVPKPESNQNQSVKTISFWIDGRGGFDKLEELHLDLSKLAMKWIKEGRRGVEEYWPSTDRYPDGLVQYLRDFIRE